MKKIIFLVFILLLFPTISIGTPITVTSYRYDISLQYWNDTQNHTYTGNDRGPLIKHSIPFPDDYFMSGKAVKSWVSPFNIYVDTFNLEDEAASAQVTAEWNFTPNSNKINLNIDGKSLVWWGGSGGSSRLSYGLFDITDNHLLVNDSRYFQPPYSENYDSVEDLFGKSFVFDVLQNKNYRLILFAEAFSLDGVRASIRADFNTVPEPGTLLLLGAGLVGLLGFRKRMRRD